MISEQFSSVIYEISKVCSSQRVSMFPRWNGLSHFSSGIMSMGFSDGSKFEDLSKVQLFSILAQVAAEHHPCRFLPLFFIIHLKKRHQATSC